MEDMEVLLQGKRLNDMAKVLKAIGHTNRLRIVQLLLVEKELMVNEICARLTNCEQSLLSHHLAALKEAGVLACRKEGRKIYYYPAKPEIKKLLNCLENCCHE